MQSDHNNIRGLLPVDPEPDADSALEDVAEWCGYSDSDNYLSALPKKRRAIFPKEE